MKPDIGKICFFTLLYQEVYCDVYHGSLTEGIGVEENYGGAKNVSARNNIPIRNLILENIVGSVNITAVPIYILCAEDGCFDWTFANVMIEGSRENSCNFTPDDFIC
ncbi:hypothetical protein HUJ05_001248 [Dendroctonus ponderosae]|nr:hypothetical protein HUJ05_001248 [Dendroctonus ponderosae]